MERDVDGGRCVCCVGCVLCACSARVVYRTERLLKMPCLSCGRWVHLGTREDRSWQTHDGRWRIVCARCDEAFTAVLQAHVEDSAALVQYYEQQQEGEEERQSDEEEDAYDDWVSDIVETEEEDALLAQQATIEADWWAGR